MARPLILVTGADGQLGHELARVLAAHGEVRPTTRASLDLADADAIAATMRALQPALVINAGAYTAVDRAEEERDLAFAVNARGPGVLADEARRCGAVLVHFSTDYVFDGAAQSPYTETSVTNPLSVYGASKLAGEAAVMASGAAALVFRTSWVYGARGTNFLLTIRKLAREREELRIVADQWGVPNWVGALADAVDRVVGCGTTALRERAGLYHLSCAGETTWYDFARAIVGDVAQPRIVPITTAEFPRPARRPRYAVLDTTRFVTTFGFALPDWRVALERCRQTLPH